MAVRIPYNPKVLAQAAEVADESIREKFPALNQWISQERYPTVLQLADFAKKVNIPFGHFFLEHLPEKENTVPLFRTGSGKPIYKYSIDLQETITILEMRQDWLNSYLKNERRATLPFVGSVTIESEVKEIAGKIRQEIDLPPNWAAGMPDKDRVLSGLIGKIEAIGIYVVINGTVNNNTHRVLDRNEFQGFALSDKYAPFIFLNGQDYKAAQIFTLMHELAHIWLGVTAISDFEKLQPAADKTEQLCNAVAAELLVPATELEAAYKKFANTENAIYKLAGIFKVSRIVIARRLLDMGAYTKRAYFSFYNSEKLRWDANKKAGKGGNFYLNQAYKVGSSFFKIIDNAARSGKLLYSDAYRLTSLYGNTYHTFSQKMQ